VTLQRFGVRGRLKWSMPVAEHLVASTRGLDRSLLDPERAQWPWEHLLLVITGILSLVLMPDHLHLVAAPGQRELLVRLLARFTAWTGVRFDVAVPEVAHGRKTAGRMMRYGFFNPVWADLVDDPWRWQWSTLRDLGGAAHPCCTPLDRIAGVLGYQAPVVLRTLTTMANRTAPPPRADGVRVASIDGVRTAVAAALRIPVTTVHEQALGRRLVVQACDSIAGPTAGRLAGELGCSVRSVFRLRAPQHPALSAVLTCLGDARLVDPAGR
jgi:hypothetical protein